jgi:ABC-2 type transport system ATP-binding protein
MGKTIMVSSHILPELADICNKIGIIERGELIVNADVADVMRQVRQQTVLRIDVAGDREAAARLLESHEIVETVEVNEKGLRLTLVPGDHDHSVLARLLVEADHALTRLSEEEINLETAFMTLTKGITS